MCQGERVDVDVARTPSHLRNQLLARRQPRRQLLGPRQVRPRRRWQGKARQLCRQRKQPRSVVLRKRCVQVCVTITSVTRLYCVQALTGSAARAAATKKTPAKKAPATRKKAGETTGKKPGVRSGRK